MVKLENARIMHGPNLLSAEPVAVAALQIEKEAGARALQAAGDIARLFEDFSLPVVPDRTEDEELFVGQFLASWASQAITSNSGVALVSGAKRGDGEVAVWVGYFSPRHSFDWLSTGAHILRSAMAGTLTERDAQDLTSKSALMASQFAPDYIAYELQKAAKAKGIPVMPVSTLPRHWQYGWGERSRIFHEVSPMEDSRIGSSIASSKDRTVSFLRELGFPTPAGQLVDSEEQVESVVKEIGLPCVVKPLDRGGGKGVTADLAELPAVISAFRNARQFSRQPILIERHIAGDEYRLMVVRGKFFCAVRRSPATVTGDGKRTIEELVTAENEKRIVERDTRPFLVQIPMDEQFHAELRRQGVEAGSILQEGMEVRLRGNSNRSTGGTCQDFTEAVHPDLVRISEMIAASLQIDVLGIDYITPDPSQSYTQVGGAIIEVNTHANIALPIAAGRDPVETAMGILGPRPGRIPVSLALVNQGEATHLQKQPQAPRATSGWVCGEGNRVAAGVGSTPHAVRFSSIFEATTALLTNRGVSDLSIVTTPADIVHGGMPVDRVDRLVLCGGELDSEWRSVLVGRCDELVEPDDAETLAALLKVVPDNTRPDQEGA